jgi:F0F1-type ATP synthase assembly protein I
MNFLIGLLIFVGAIILVPVAVKYGLKILLIVLVVAGVGAIIGWGLDMVFDTSPMLTIGSVVVVLVGLVGSSLENTRVSS